VENFQANLDALKIKRAALEEQMKKEDADVRSLQDQLREANAQIWVLEDAIADSSKRPLKKQEPVRPPPLPPDFPDISQNPPSKLQPAPDPSARPDQIAGLSQEPKRPTR
jgi:hypothetical protein